MELMEETRNRMGRTVKELRKFTLYGMGKERGRNL